MRKEPVLVKCPRCSKVFYTKKEDKTQCYGMEGKQCGCKFNISENKAKVKA